MNLTNFQKMMQSAESTPVDFEQEWEAEDHVVAYERGVANVVKGGVIFSIYFGKAHERKESK